jgi:hypothetical protein
VLSFSIHSACGGTLDVLATVLGLRLLWFAKGGGFLVCKRSSSDLVRHEPNSIEMRCDIAWMWWFSGLQKVIE